MPGSVYEIVREDFVAELDAIRQLVNAFDGVGREGRTRLAAANSATLLVAAKFEEFVREMAREYARAVVASAPSIDELPKKLLSTAWKRSMEGLARVRFDVEQPARESLMVDAQVRFSIVYDFVKGDITKDVYRDLIHNENNMRPGELNSMFNVAGLGNLCGKACERSAILTFFGETEAGKAHTKLLGALEDFFERRNGIAHWLSRGQSNGPEQIFTDLDMLQAFSEAMFQTLEAVTPQPPSTEAIVDPAPVPDLGTATAPAVQGAVGQAVAEPGGGPLEGLTVIPE